MPSKTVLLVVEPGDSTPPLGPDLQNQFQILKADSAGAVQAASQQGFAGVLFQSSQLADKSILLCRALREAVKEAAVPVMVIVNASAPSSRIAFFQAGADDVFDHSIDRSELFIRIEARIQRLRQAANGGNLDRILTVGDLHLDLGRVEARIGARKVPLGPVEFKILSLLARSLGQLRSREEIEAYVWGENRPATRALDPHINALRKKIFGSGLDLRTVYGAGYSLRLESDPAKVV